MATLVLSTVGTMLGGPIGGALGSLVGQTIDQSLFGPGPRRGPRLGDLSVQTSSYGSQIPRVYGSMRVAGTVVWATDLKEEENVEGGGKSGPEVVTYAYSVSLAVALSSRQAVRVRRIWADGKLLRGASGDFKVQCAFRFHPGSESQPVDPLIASIEGAGRAPAFRGLALAVFEDLALVEYGNRIPMLTFELVADEAPVAVNDILSDVSRGVIAGQADATVTGYAAHAADQRGAIEDLVALWDVRLTERSGRLDVVGDPEPIAVSGDRERGCLADGQREADGEQRGQEPSLALPASLTLNFYDQSRDYQAGQMRAVVPGGGRGQWRIDSPVVLEASGAKGLANAAMARRWAERDRMTVRLPPSFASLTPGSPLQLDDAAGLWLAEAVTIDGLVVIAELRRSAAGGVAQAADPGRSTSEPDVAIGTTDLALFDLPLPGPQGGLAVTLAATSDGGFKPVPVALSVGGQPFTSVSMTRRAVMGRAMNILAPGSPLMIDDRHDLDIALTHIDQVLLNADEDALAAGSNLMLVGNELLQFGEATEIAPGRYRLSRLLRGRRGTEWAVGGHAAGERVVLIDRAALVAVTLEPGMRGAAVDAAAYGIADDRLSPPLASVRADGESLRPPSPCHLTASILSDGGLEIAWVRRCRTAFAWVDANGDCNKEDVTFRVEVAGPSGSWAADVSSPHASIGPAALEALGDGQLSIFVRQIEPAAQSRPATTIIN